MAKIKTWKSLEKEFMEELTDDQFELTGEKYLVFSKYGNETFGTKEEAQKFMRIRGKNYFIRQETKPRRKKIMTTKSKLKKVGGSIKSGAKRLKYLLIDRKGHERKAHDRKAYTRKPHTRRIKRKGRDKIVKVKGSKVKKSHVDKSYVDRTTFKTKDRGKPGRSAKQE